MLSYNLAAGGATIDNALVPAYPGDLASQFRLFEDVYADKPASAHWSAEDAVFGVWIGINEYILPPPPPPPPPLRKTTRPPDPVSPADDRSLSGPSVAISMDNANLWTRRSKYVPLRHDDFARMLVWLMRIN